MHCMAVSTELLIDILNRTYVNKTAYLKCPSVQRYTLRSNRHLTLDVTKYPLEYQTMYYYRHNSIKEPILLSLFHWFLLASLESLNTSARNAIFFNGQLPS